MTIADHPNKSGAEGITGSYLDVKNEILRLTASLNQKMRIKEQLSKTRSATINKEKKTEIEVTDFEEKDQAASIQDELLEKQCQDVNVETSELKLECKRMDMKLKECESKIVELTDSFSTEMTEKTMETLDMNITSINQACQMSMSSTANALRGDIPPFTAQTPDDKEVGEDMPVSRPVRSTDPSTSLKQDKQ